MKRAFLALLLTLPFTAGVATAGQIIGPPQPPGFGLDLSLVSVSNSGRDAVFQVEWFGPGYYSFYGGCPTGDCDNGTTSYGQTQLVLPPGGAGIFTHTGVPFPDLTTYHLPTSAYTSYQTGTTYQTVTSQPNYLHAFFLMKHGGYGANTTYTTYPVEVRTSYPGTSVAGPGRNYVATINVTGLTPGEYSATAFQRLLHYRTYTYTTKGSPSPCGICVGGTATGAFPYLLDLQPLVIPAIIPTMDRGGLIALALFLAGLGVLVLQRKSVRVRG